MPMMMKMIVMMTLMMIITRTMTIMMMMAIMTTVTKTIMTNADDIFTFLFLASRWPCWVGLLTFFYIK